MAKARTVGRSPKNHKVLNNAKISKYYCAFYFEDNGVYYLMDLDSLNGTMLNSKRVEPMERHRLEEHDIVAIRLIGEPPIILKWYQYFEVKNTLLSLEEIEEGNMDNTIISTREMSFEKGDSQIDQNPKSVFSKVKSSFLKTKILF